MRTRRVKSDKALLVALDESMESILGKSAVQAVYYHLEKSYLLKPEDIPEKPQVFAKAIKGIFGESGAEVIESLLVKDLLARLGVEGQGEESSNLVNWLDKLKNTHSKK